MPKRVNKTDWLQGALDFILEHGVFGMTPNRLAKYLGTSRSSYYWHFKCQEDFREQIIDYWIDTYTNKVAVQLTSNDGTPGERLNSLLALIREKGLTRYEAAAHALAYGDEKLMRKIKDAYQVRFRFIKSILADTGMDENELVAHSRLFLCYATWEAEMGFAWKNGTYAEHHKFVASLVA